MSETSPTHTNPFSAGCAWIEGEYLPIGEARIPILDAGFTRSDVTYDVAAVWQGRFFRLDDHLDRIEAGCARIRLELPLPKPEIKAIMIETVRRSGLTDAYVEVVITRGVPGPGERDPRLWTPRLYAYAVPYVWIVKPEIQEVGIDVIVARNTRRIPEDSVDPTVKNFHWGDLVRGLFEAYDRGAVQAILPDANGMVTEGAGFNVFALVDDVLRTPERGVLLGITRRTVLEIADRLEIPTVVGQLTTDELARATEVFFTSTAGGVMPVATVDGRELASAHSSSVTARIRQHYWDLHTDPILSELVDY